MSEGGYRSTRVCVCELKMFYPNRKPAHIQSGKCHEINQDLDSQPFSSPDDEASEEDYDHARLDRADEHG